MTCLPGALFCQESGSVISARYAASFSDYGQVHKFDGSVGYKFNKHIELGAGVPFYMVRSSTELGESTSTSTSGIGNAYLNLNLAADTSLFRYWSVASVTAPTGDKSKGLSTGRVTFDWTHGFAKDIGRITPFGSLGVANAITDSPFWIRPFSALGVNAHAEGGGLVRLGGPVSVGASLYTVLPIGNQKVYSRVVHGNSGQTTAGQTETGNGQGGSANAPGLNKKRIFETAAVTTGESSLTRDDGASVWLTARLTPAVSFTAIYTRSRTYSLDSFSVGFGFDIGSLIKARRL